VDKYFLSELIVQPCQGCESCQSEGSCKIVDDDAALVLGALSRCDALIIGSPVYYRNVTAQLKALFDRSFAYGPQLLEGKPGGAIAVGRGEGGGQANVLMVIYNFMLSCGGLPVPGELNGLSARADQPGEILLQPTRLEQARILARNVMRYTKQLHLEKQMLNRQ